MRSNVAPRQILKQMEVFLWEEPGWNNSGYGEKFIFIIRDLIGREQAVEVDGSIDMFVYLGGGDRWRVGPIISCVGCVVVGCV